MLNIKVLGPGCENCHRVEEAARAAAEPRPGPMEGRDGSAMRGRARWPGGRPGGGKFRWPAKGERGRLKG